MWEKCYQIENYLKETGNVRTEYVQIRKWIAAHSS